MFTIYMYLHLDVYYHGNDKSAYQVFQTFHRTRKEIDFKQNR